jgi:hypothetical protein
MHPLNQSLSMPNHYYHEIWLSPDEDGELLPSCIPLGPAGDAARSVSEPGSECVWIFWAMSHIEAMQIYYEFMDFGTYQTEFREDSMPFPNAWISEQLAFLSTLRNG